MIIIAGEISTQSTATFDYQTQAVYTLEVTASDGEYDDVQNLTIYIARDDTNNKPFFTSDNMIVNISESEASFHVVMDIDGSDPDNDALIYMIQSSIPTEAPFIINNNNGKVTFEDYFVRSEYYAREDQC